MSELLNFEFKIQIIPSWTEAFLASTPFWLTIENKSHKTYLLIFKIELTDSDNFKGNVVEVTREYSLGVLFTLKGSMKYKEIEIF